MITLTFSGLKSICKYADSKKLQSFIPWLNQYMSAYEINTLLRAQHFVAQIAHESGSFNYVEEITSGVAYEGRKDLGNIYSGDGTKFKGRGLIQITGRSNFTLAANELNIDCVNHPELLSTPQYAVESACWFWKKHDLNEWADDNDIHEITKIINGGFNGLQDRIAFFQLCHKYIV